MDLAQVEALCRTICGPQASQQERLEAHHKLLFLQLSASYIDQCKMILERSTEQTALMYAAESIIKVMRRDWGNISQASRLSLRDFLVNYLTNASNTRHFMTRKLIQVLCELTRRAWCEDARHHAILDQCVQWMRASSTADLGLRVMADLVTEFDQGRTAFFDEATRRASQAFREQEAGLSKAFYVSVDAVAAAHSSRNLSLLCESLRCLLACLSFDFASTGADESVPGVSCVYLPKSWVHAVASEGAISRLFSLYTEQWQSKAEELNEEAATLVMQCLVLVAGTRRTSHDAGSRPGFVRALLTGSEALLRTRMGFDRSEDCTHHSCRLIARIKISVHVNEMASEAIYSQWLAAVRDFTSDALRSWLTVSPRSINYLLEFWSGMATSALNAAAGSLSSGGAAQWPAAQSGGMRPSSSPTATTAGEASHFSDPFAIGDALVPVVDAYLTSRAVICECAALNSSRNAHVESALQAARDAGLAARHDPSSPRCDLEEVNPLAAEESLIDEIGLVLPMTRVRYTKSAETLGGLLMRATTEYSAMRMQGLSSVGPQAKLAFCMYFVGALIGGPISRDNTYLAKQIDEFNLELAALAFRVVIEKKNLCSFPLEMASLYFLQCFQYLLLESRTRAQVARTELRARRAMYYPGGMRLYHQRSLRSATSNPTTMTGVTPTTMRGSVPSSPQGGPSMAHFFNPDPLSQQQQQQQTNANAAGTSMDDFFVTKPVELFPRPIRSFEAEAAESMIEERLGGEDGDEGEYDEMPSLLASSSTGGDLLRGRGRQRYSADLDQTTPVIVDEFDVLEADMLTLDLKRASALQRTVADRVGVQGGDRALLDIAVQHIFSVLQIAPSAIASIPSYAASSTSVYSMSPSTQVKFLIERALGVLRKLAQGTSVVQAGLQSTPRIVSSGMLLLESEYIQGLLKNANPDHFALMSDSIDHGRARTFFMSTMTSLFFLHCEAAIANTSNSTSSSSSGANHNQNGSTTSIITLASSSGKSPSIIPPITPLPPGEQPIRFVLSPAERTEDAFGEFMRPFSDKCDRMMREPDLRPLRRVLISLLRDLRGIVSATEEPKQYDLIFAWFFPNRIHLLRKAAIVFWDDADVGIPLLRLVGELVTNRSSRIAFPVSSGGGHALVMETCRVMLDYCRPHLERLSQQLQKDAQMVVSAAATTASLVGAAADKAAGGNGASSSLSMAALQAIVEELSQQQDAGEGGGGGSRDPSAIKLAPGAVGPGLTVRQTDRELKCVAACATAMTRIATGRFANLSVFQVFGDNTLKDLRRAIAVWGLASPPDHLQSFSKVESALVQFAQSVADSNPLELVQLPSGEFARLMVVLAQAVSKPVSALSTPAAFTIESLATLRCKAILYSMYVKESNGNAGGGASSSSSSGNSSGALGLRQSGFVSADLGAAHRVRSRIAEEHELRAASIAFAQHDVAQPQIFAQVLGSLLDRLLTAPDSELTNLYALSRPITSLSFSSPNALASFVNGFIGAQAQSRQLMMQENLEPIVKVLMPGTTREHMADALRRQDEYTKDLCRYVRRFRDFYWSL